MTGKEVRFPGLGVSVHDGGVWQWPFSKRRLGDLHGAQAQMGSASTKHGLGEAAGAALNPLTLPLAPFLAMRKKVQTAVFIAFADGTVHRKDIKADQRSVNAVEAEVIRFNALARPASPGG